MDAEAHQEHRQTYDIDSQQWHSQSEWILHINDTPIQSDRALKQLSGYVLE